MPPSRAAAARFAHLSDWAPTTPMVLYTGTFEPYQGLDLLFAAAKVVGRQRADVRFVLAGGKPDQVANAKVRAVGDWREQG